MAENKRTRPRRRWGRVLAPPTSESVALTGSARRWRSAVVAPSRVPAVAPRTVDVCATRRGGPHHNGRSSLPWSQAAPSSRQQRETSGLPPWDEERRCRRPCSVKRRAPRHPAREQASQRAARVEPGNERGKHDAPIADDAHVAVVKHRGMRISVHRQQQAGAPNPGEMVRGTAQPDREMKERGDAAPGDADLSGTREQALVGDLAGRGELGAENGGEVLELGGSRPS